MNDVLQPDRVLVAGAVLALLGALAGACWQMARAWTSTRQRAHITHYILAGLTPRARAIRQIEVLNRLVDGEDTTDLRP